MKKITTLLIICALTLSAMAQVQVYSTSTPLPEKGVKGLSVNYALPTTTFKMTVSVSKVQEVRGYFADYAESLLGLTNIIQQNRTHYTLNSVDIEPISTANMSERYIAITSNPDISDAWMDALTATQNAVADMTPISYSTHTASLPDFFKNYADISYTQQSEAFVETKIIDGVVTQVPASHTKTVSKSFENKAREAADAIMKSRKDQYNLVAGEQETPYSGEALQIMLSELKNWENNYMSLFTGVSISDTTIYVIYVTPENLNPTTAFYFDANKGFDPTKGTSSEAYTLNFKRLYEYYRELTEINYPLNHYITRSCKPAAVSLMHNNSELHNFGIINMYQAGSKEILNTSSKKSIDITTIGFIF
jgi:hypothetical protein